MRETRFRRRNRVSGISGSTFLFSAGTLMTLQEIINSLDNLSVQEQDYLVELIRQRREEKQGINFWEGFQKFRATIEKEGIILMMKILLICAIGVLDEKLIYEVKIFS
jgi:hypothetical protein